MATQGFSKVVKVTSVAVISNRAFSGGIRARLGNRGYIRDFGKTLHGDTATRRQGEKCQIMPVGSITGRAGPIVFHFHLFRPVRA